MSVLSGPEGNDLTTVPDLICSLCKSPVAFVESNKFACKCYTWRLIYDKPVKNAEEIIKGVSQ